LKVENEKKIKRNPLILFEKYWISKKRRFRTGMAQIMQNKQKKSSKIRSTYTIIQRKVLNYNLLL